MKQKTNNQQNKMADLIDELKKIDGKQGRPYNIENKKDIKEVVENAAQLYKTRNDIINEIRDIKNEQKKQTKF